MASSEAHVILSGFIHLLFSQIASRVLTFILNIAVVRQLPPEVYGVAVIQFHLITTTILTFAREGVRRACLRGVELGSKKSTDLRSITQLSWFCVPQGVFWSLVVCSVVLLSSGKDRDGAYTTAVLLHGLAAIIEVCSEPPYIVSNCLLLFKLQVAVETLATTSKCLITLFLLVYTDLKPLLAFGVSAMVYSSSVCLGYWVYFLWKKKDMKIFSFKLITFRETDKIDSSIYSAFSSFTLQAIEKHFLGEGEKFAMALFQPTYDQGVYGLVNNLGSLIVRTAFQPFEQAVFTAFSMSSKDSKEGSSKKQQADILVVVLKVVLLFGLLFLTFGYNYSFTILWISYGAKWALTEAPLILSVYFLYVSTMALNGVSEAFVHATADERALKQINLSLIIFSVLNCITSVILVYSFKTAGLVAAGCISMCLRIAYCLVYINKYFVSEFSISSAFPSTIVCLAAFCTFGCLNVSENLFIPDPNTSSLRSMTYHLLVGVTFGLALLLTIYINEKDLIQSIAKLLRKNGEHMPEKGKSD